MLSSCFPRRQLSAETTTHKTSLPPGADWNPQNDLQAQARAHRLGQVRGSRAPHIHTACSVTVLFRCVLNLLHSRLDLVHRSEACLCFALWRATRLRSAWCRWVAAG